MNPLAELCCVIGMGLITIPVAPMRDHPRHAAQMVSQAVMGTPVEIIDSTANGDWLGIITPDGYRGYVTASSVAKRDLKSWRDAPRAIVTDVTGAVIVDTAGSVVARLPLNSIVELTVDATSTVTLPDGRQGSVDTLAFMPLEQWALQPFDGAKITATARQYLGAPYLWGGITGYGPDCSGLVSLCYMANGRIVRRDAWMQQADATPLKQPTQPADLIFFDRDYNGTTDHVAIYEGNGRYIHSSGQVKENYLNSADGDTITGRVSSFGRPSPASAANHPAFFNQ